MLRASLAVLVAVCLAGIAQARKDGAPIGACPDLEPLGHKNEENTYDETKDVFTIGSACYVFLPGESMLMTVWPRVGDGLFKGIITQVRRVDPNEKNGRKLIAGTFTTGTGDLSTYFKTTRCGNAASDTVTHTNGDDKNPKGQNYRWTAPATCKKNEEYEIRATIVKEFSNYQTGIVVPLVCNPDYSDCGVMNRVRPPLVAQYCSVQSWAIIPKGLTTSFEDGFGGWRVLRDGDWLRRNSPTPTRGTGPDKAHDGNYFLHYEATGKAAGNNAVLYTDRPVEGCFCFSFWCHMRTDGEVLFRARADGFPISRVMVSTKEITNYWRQVKVSVLTGRPVYLTIEVVRGNSDVADIGIDTISVEPGKCKGTGVINQFLQ